MLIQLRFYLKFNVMIKNLKEVMELILDDAEERRQNAGFNGQHSDGGARELEEKVEIYRHGLEGSFPTEWVKYVKQYKKENDPEYKMYLRLKEQFEEAKAKNLSLDKTRGKNESEQLD